MYKIIQGDALDELRKLPDKSIDLVLTDPPYGLGEAAGKNKTRGKLATVTDFAYKTWDNHRIDKKLFDEIFRVSKHQIIFGGNYYTDYLPPSSCWIVWDKDNGKTHFADCELAWTNYKSAVRKIKWRWSGMLQEDMKHKEKRYHPTQKPIAVMRWIIERYAKPGETILDPFMGSGSTLIAATQLGYDCIGIEREADYCEIAKSRLEAL